MTNTQQSLDDKTAKEIIRNEYYKDGFKSLLKLAFLEAVVIVGLIIALIIYINSKPPSFTYFVTKPNGSVEHVRTLPWPNINQNSLESWISQAVTEVMTFGFHDMEERHQRAKRFFTDDGWESFQRALVMTGIVGKGGEMGTIEKFGQILTAAPQSIPTIMSDGFIRGTDRQFWVYSIPLSVTYQVGSKSKTDRTNVIVAVHQVPTWKNPAGVGINQWTSY